MKIIKINLWNQGRQMAKFARCSFEKTTANCFNSFCHFHLISSVSRPQRPLIYDCIYFSYPTLPCRQHFRGKFFRCPFHTKSALPTFLCFLRPWKVIEWKLYEPLLEIEWILVIHMDIVWK